MNNKQVKRTGAVINDIPLFEDISGKSDNYFHNAQVYSSVEPDQRSVMQKLHFWFVDSSVGLIHEVLMIYPGPGEVELIYSFSVCANMSLLAPDIEDVTNLAQGAGVGITKESASIKAVGEAVERYCLWTVNEKVTYKSYEEIASTGSAIVPSRLQQHSRQSAEIVTDVDEYTRLHWVEAVDGREGTPIYIPAAFIYMGFKKIGPEPWITYSNTSGAACSNDFLSAILKAIYEVVERDAIMLAWYSEYRAPKLELSSFLSGKEKARFRIDDIEHIVSYIMTDLGIPTILTTLIEHRGSGERVFMGAAAGLDPSIVLSRSLAEAHAVRNSFNLATDDDKIPVLTSNDIRTIKDRINFYGNPGKASHVDFLRYSPDVVNFEDIFNLRSQSVAQQLSYCIQKLDSLNIDFYYKDVTKADVRPSGLKVVRVIVPQALQLTIDHRVPMINEARLLDVPAKLRWNTRANFQQSVNENPHPFG